MIEIKSPRILRIILFLIIFLSFSFSAYAKYSGGMGEPDDPYQIASAEDLMLLGESPEDYDKHFILTADIDMDPNLPGRKVFDRAVIAPDTNDVESGFQGTPFTGVFDGNSHTISNLTIEGNEELGLFGQLDSEATIFNLGLEAVHVHGTGTVIGGLVGSNFGAIAGCYVKGSVMGTEFVGGLSGANLVDGTIARCFAACTVQTEGTGGGFVGLNAGYQAPVSAPLGLRTRHVAIISDCYTILVGDSHVSGLLVGQNGKQMGMMEPYYPSVIANCYASFEGSGKIETSGMVGLNYCVYGWPGGVINCFWDAETTGVADIAEGGTPKTTAQMQITDTFLCWGGFGDEPIWTIDQGKDYPRLYWENKSGEVIKPIFLSDFLSGTGSKDDPYLVYTAEELNLVGLGLRDWDRHFMLMADIDLSEYVYSAAMIARDFYDTPSGTYYDSAFTGVFDGNGYTISNLTIVGVDYVGLFRKLGDGAEIKNMGIVDANIMGDSPVGSFVGYNNGGNIFNSFSTGTVSGERDVGGLVGHNMSGSITACHNTGIVSGTRKGVGDIGGLVGENSYEGNIISSYSTGDVSGDQTVGGLVGYNRSGSITGSYNTGSVSGNRHVGGLAGANPWGNITNCSNTGSVSGNFDVGGLVGDNSESISTSFNIGSVSGERNIGGLVGLSRGKSSITISYNTGMVSGDRAVGGLVGRNSGSINSSFSTGKVIGEEEVGGLVGDNADYWEFFKIINDSFWDIENSGQETSDGGIGKTTAEMQDVRTYLDAGWDFVNEAINGTCDYWKMSPGEYPQLSYPVMPEGLGSAEQPYLIRDARDLGTVWSEPTAHYRLEDSIDLSGINWSMAVIPWFGGIFDGNNHIISNLHIQGDKHLGLFGQVQFGAKISNLGVDAFDVNGTGDYVGGLAGDNNGSITACYSSGTAFGDSSVGGLVGYNGGTVTVSYSTGIVTGDRSVGGLVGGSERSNITSSYSIADVSGEWGVGGLVGATYKATITTSYSVGAVTGDEKVGGLVGADNWNNANVTASACLSVR